jgi:hypothetical protein
MQAFEIDVTGQLSFAAYEDRWRLAKRQIKSSEWTDGIRYTDQPEYFRRRNKGRGRVLPGEPENKQGCCYYGFDRDGLVVVSHQYGADGEVIETFYDYGDEYWQTVHYRFEGESFGLLSVDRYYHTHERLDTYHVYRIGFETRRHAPDENLFICTYREQYGYDARGRLATIQTRRLASPTHTAVIDYQLEYDAVGRLDYIEKIEDEGEGYIIYQRPLKGQTVANLQVLIQQRLLALVPVLLDQLAEGNERFYAAALIYDFADENCLPPTLVLGLADLRDQLIDLYGDEAADFIWDPEVLIGYESPDGAISLPGKPPYSLEGVDEMLDEASFLLNQHLAFMGQPERVRDLLNEVARQLMTRGLD